MRSSRRNLAALAWNVEQDSIAKARTPPQQWYTNRELFEQEQLHLFKKYPQYVGHLQQLSPRKGSYIAGKLMDEPYIAIRQSDHEIASFFNVCRHHASQLTLDAIGCIDAGKGLQCPYHGWTYNLEGELIKATKLKGIEDFKRKEMGLLSIPHHLLFDDLLFLNLALNQSATTELFEGVLRSVTEYSESMGFDQSKLVHVYSRRYLLRCNWKVFIENYLDGGYHVPHLHLGLNSNLDPGSYRTELGDYVSFQSVASNAGSSADSVSKEKDFVERIGDRGLYTFIYPNFLINRYGKWMDINYVYPKSVDETYVHFDYFLHHEAPTGDAIEDALEMDGDIHREDEQALTDGYYRNLHRFSKEEVQFIKESIAASHQVQAEDMLICDAVSNGLKSTAYQQLRGRYAPQLETALYQFHQLYNRDMFE